MGRVLGEADFGAVEAVVVAAVFEFFFDAAADFEVAVGGYGNVAGARRVCGCRRGGGCRC